MAEATGYHAHVYFDAASRPTAERLRDTIISRFAVKPGGFSDKPVGPHLVSQFNVMFQTDEFQRIVPWLMLNREGLNVLVHPLTDDMLDDHTVYAMWLGAPVDLRVDTLQRRGYQDALLPTTVAHPA
jgi:aromatic ring-cleaving dioxygenase